MTPLLCTSQPPVGTMPGSRCPLCGHAAAVHVGCERCPVCELQALTTRHHRQQQPGLVTSNEHGDGATPGANSGSGPDDAQPENDAQWPQPRDLVHQVAPWGCRLASVTRVHPDGTLTLHCPPGTRDQLVMEHVAYDDRARPPGTWHWPPCGSVTSETERPGPPSSPSITVHVHGSVLNPRDLTRTLRSMQLRNGGTDRR